MSQTNNAKVTVQSTLLMQASALILSCSNIFSKFAAKEPFLSWRFLFLYGCSLVVMFVYAILWQQILKRVDMIVAYTNRLVAMIWGIVWGLLIFGESISIQNGIGTVVIIVGLYIVVNADE